MHKNCCPCCSARTSTATIYARAFHERYGVRSHAFGKYRIGVTKHTRILDFTVVPDLDSPEKVKSTLIEFAKAQSDRIMMSFRLHGRLCRAAFDAAGRAQRVLHCAVFGLFPDKTADRQITVLRALQAHEHTISATHAIAPDAKPEIPFRCPVVIGRRSAPNTGNTSSRA